MTGLSPFKTFDARLSLVLSAHCRHSTIGTDAAVAARIADIRLPYGMRAPHRLVCDEGSRFRPMEQMLVMHPQLSWTI